MRHVRVQFDDPLCRFFWYVNATETQRELGLTTFDDRSRRCCVQRSRESFWLVFGGFQDSRGVADYASMRRDLSPSEFQLQPERRLTLDSPHDLSRPAHDHPTSTETSVGQAFVGYAAMPAHSIAYALAASRTHRVEHSHRLKVY